MGAPTGLERVPHLSLDTAVLRLTCVPSPREKEKPLGLRPLPQGRRRFLDLILRCPAKDTGNDEPTGERTS